MVSLFGIVLFVCCMLSLTQGQDSTNSNERYNDNRRKLIVGFPLTYSAIANNHENHQGPFAPQVTKFAQVDDDYWVHMTG
ncbi:unnamed protein product, partial [Brenthis ino]